MSDMTWCQQWRHLLVTYIIILHTMTTGSPTSGDHQQSASATSLKIVSAVAVAVAAAAAAARQVQLKAVLQFCVTDS